MAKTPLETDIETLCKEIIYVKGWRPFNDVTATAIPIKKGEESPIILAPAIKLDTRTIIIPVAEDLYSEIDLFIAQEKLPETRDSLLEKIIYFSIVHEYGHHQYCPRSQEHFQRLLKGAFDVVHTREYRTEKIQEICLHIQNMFSDTILNTINAHVDSDKAKFREGFDNLYLLFSNYTKSKFKQRGDKALSLHINVNHLLCDTDDALNKKLDKYSAALFLGFERYRKKVIDVFTSDESLTNAVLERKMSPEDTSTLIGRIENADLWEKMSYDYATIVYPLIRRTIRQLENSYSRKNEPSESQKGSGAGSGVPQQKNPQQDYKKQQESKSDQDKENTPEPKKNENKKKKHQSGNKNVEDYDKKKLDTGKDDPKEGDDKKEDDDKHEDQDFPKQYDIADYFKKLLQNEHKPFSSPFLAQFGRLDMLYTLRAQRLGLYAEDPNRSSPHHEQYISREEMPFEEFSHKDIEWSSTRIFTEKDNSKSFELYRKDIPLIFPFESTEKKGGGIPDISFIFDSSISMNFKPFEGNGRGEYHLAALTFYSILKDLEEKGIAGLLNYHMINFSFATHSSGWCSYGEINRVKRTLFDYQGNGTILDPKALADLRKNRRDNVISFMLSDTEFNLEANTDAIIREVDMMVNCGGIGFYLFQLGPQTRFSKAMEHRKIGVHHINSVEDFMNMSIQFTKELYGEAIKT